jgi:hypothetical protein
MHPVGERKLWAAEYCWMGQTFLGMSLLAGGSVIGVLGLRWGLRHGRSEAAKGTSGMPWPLPVMEVDRLGIGA